MNVKENLRISITSLCNMQCRYCHNEGNIEESILTKNQIKKIIDSLDGHEIASVRLTGGEPLISPEIEDICELLAIQYGINVEINTNGIEIDKLLKLINRGWVKGVVIGIDLFDADISKSSPIGQSSKTIKENILRIKQTDCNVYIDMVYNGDNNNAEKMIRWAINNDIEIRILEMVSRHIDKLYVKKFNELQSIISNKIELNWYIDRELHELKGTMNGKTLVIFYNSLCRLQLCNLCKKIQIRITSNGTFRPCIMNF
ncbi:MAG: radical SAM protein [Clostridia bacterium]|nr:radical SAM protein [Clostridia bacterium]